MASSELAAAPAGSALCAIQRTAEHRGASRRLVPLDWQRKVKRANGMGCGGDEQLTEREERRAVEIPTPSHSTRTRICMLPSSCSQLSPSLSLSPSPSTGHPPVCLSVLRTVGSVVGLVFPSACAVVPPSQPESRLADRHRHGPCRHTGTPLSRTHTLIYTRSTLHCNHTTVRHCHHIPLHGRASSRRPHCRRLRCRFELSRSDLSWPALLVATA